METDDEVEANPLSSDSEREPLVTSSVSAVCEERLEDQNRRYRAQPVRTKTAFPTAGPDDDFPDTANPVETELITRCQRVVSDASNQFAELLE